MSRLSRMVLISLAILSVTAFAGAFSAHANDSSFEGQGATVYLVKESRIRMVEENVEIRPVARENGLPVWTAECRFKFENLADEAVDVLMGFPDWNAEMDDPGAHSKKAIKRFTVQVEGKKVEPDYKKVEPKPGKDQPLLPGGKRIPYAAAYTWSVHFAPHQKIEVMNSYAFGGFSTVAAFWPTVHEGKFSAAMPTIHRKDVFWKPYGGADSKELDYDDAIFDCAMYIVTTGLSWSGPIGHATISIELPKVLPNRILPAPSGFRWEKGRIVWEFRDWRPETELVLYVLSLLRTDGQGISDVVFGTQRETAGWIEWARKNHVDRETVNFLKNAFFARHGHDFDNPAIAARIEGIYTKAPGKKVALSDLPPDEQASVKLLEEFEKSLPEK